jgi:hypothetical protein
MRHTFKPILLNGLRPLALSKKLTIRVLGSVKLVQRMLYATRHGLCEKPWLRIARWGQPGRDLLVDTSSVEEAYARLLAGEEPPLLPSEVKRRHSGDAAPTPRAVSLPNSP